MNITTKQNNDKKENKGWFTSFLLQLQQPLTVICGQHRHRLSVVNLKYGRCDQELICVRK